MHARSMWLKRRFKLEMHYRSISSLNTSSSMIRESFQSYFEKNGHTRVKSSPLIPRGDPTLLFTNSGMVQFKEVFLGNEKRSYTQATSSQLCMRAGGKHNDLDNVGFTPRHHTLFEMLGNFSFGQYFKEEAIFFAWQYLTKELCLPPSKLSVTVFETDEESAELWRKIAGLKESRIVKFGEQDNFWMMGNEAGVPCGPCTEIFYDLGKDSVTERWLEVWNLVFMQYFKKLDGSLERLPVPCVDTGMGLERICSVVQGVSSNYETDLMKPLMLQAANIIQTRNGKLIDLSIISEDSSAVKVIVDHLRASAFLIAEGVVPSNVGSGYVLRRILRRAIRYGHKLKLEGPFLAEIYPSLVMSMGVVYPQIVERQDMVCKIIKNEEESFFSTLSRGISTLETIMTSNTRKDSTNTIIQASDAFKLYDTFGFPLDLTQIVAGEKGWQVDIDNVSPLMEAQREKSRKNALNGTSMSGNVPNNVKGWQKLNIKNSFTGYTSLEQEARVLAIDQDENEKYLNTAWVCISPNPFFPEGGGQLSDTGYLIFNEKKIKVVNVVKLQDDLIALQIENEGMDNTLSQLLPINSKVVARVDKNNRKLSSVHHSSTHLLNAALRNTLGTNVMQCGSLVSKDKLRFDFTCGHKLSTEFLRDIEKWVNDVGQSSAIVETNVLSLADAKAGGAVANFNEKYDENKVRVVSIGGFSKELCGGTHVVDINDIYPFKILSEGSVSSGTRRIEAIAGKACIDWLKKEYMDYQAVASVILAGIGVDNNLIMNRIIKMKEREKENEKEIKELKSYIILQMDNKSKYSISKGESEGKIHIHELKYFICNGDMAILKKRMETIISQTEEEKEREESENDVHILISGKDLLISKLRKGKSNNARDIMNQIMKGMSVKGGGNEVLAQGKVVGEGVMEGEDLIDKVYNVLKQ